MASKSVPKKISVYKDYSTSSQKLWKIINIPKHFLFLLMYEIIRKNPIWHFKPNLNCGKLLWFFPSKLAIFENLHILVLEFIHIYKRKMENDVKECTKHCNLYSWVLHGVYDSLLKLTLYYQAQAQPKLSLAGLC